MSIRATTLGEPSHGDAVARRTHVGLLVLIWLGAVAIAVFFALIVRDSTVVDGTYLPRGNDSFYHAHRILDALGARGFYEFDDRIQAPEGAWISWPWAYDYLMAKSALFAKWFAPALDPMAFISYVPVAWLTVNAALFLAATGVIGLTLEMRVLAMLCFAISPLTQLLHAIGMIDHHYVEHTFVLLTIWLGLRWFRDLADARRGTLLGIALGAAPAFHNGLFILQLLPLTGLFVLWLRRLPLPPRALRAFVITLLVVTQLALLPSEPYRRGMFEFGLLSWFHFYVAVCTSAAIAYMGLRRRSTGNLIGLAALSVALAAPLLAQMASGMGFLSGSFSILDQIVEVRSPFKLFTTTFGPVETAGYYSWLLLVAPALLAYYAYRVLRETGPTDIYFAVSVVFGIALLLDQMRLHYFGFFGLTTSGLLIVQQLRERHGWHRGATFAASLAVLVLAFQPALRTRLFVVYAPGGDPEYAAALPLFRDLAAQCAADPGVVLASADDGSPIVFHSACRVIANNFILRPEDKAHIDEIDRLMRLSPEQIQAERRDVKYMLVRARDFSEFHGGVGSLSRGSAIARELFLDPTPPAGYTLIDTVYRSAGSREPADIYARLYRVSVPSGAGG